MRAGTYPAMNFATLGPLELRPPFTGPSIQSLVVAPLLFSFQHRAGVRPYTSCYHFAESCVFNKQSLPPILCHPLLSKERGPPYPEVTEAICRVPSTWFSLRLGLLDLSTSVGLSTVWAEASLKRPSTGTTRSFLEPRKPEDAIQSHPTRPLGSVASRHIKATMAFTMDSSIPIDPVLSHGP